MRSKTVFIIEALLTIFVIIFSILKGYHALEFMPWSAVMLPIMILGFGRALLVLFVIVIQFLKMMKWRKRG